MAPGNKALKDLVEEGKESGFLSLEELNRSIAAADMSAEDIEKKIVPYLASLAHDAAMLEKQKMANGTYTREILSA